MDINTKTFTLFDDLKVSISSEDWDFMCKNRFFTNNPTEEDWEMEFVTGTGITSADKEEWSRADQKFTEYVEDLKRIMSLDINKAARGLLKNEKSENSVCV